MPFAQGSSGNLKVKLGDTSYYLVYEGTAVQSWTMVGLVPVSIVNASLDKLWFHTVQIVAGIAFGLCGADHSAHCAQKPYDPAPEEH